MEVYSEAMNDEILHNKILNFSFLFNSKSSVIVNDRNVKKSSVEEKLR